jgi:hypothetical protein
MQWEYYVVTIREAERITTDELNRAGEDGWELVGITPRAEIVRIQGELVTGSAVLFECVFKRPKPGATI